MNLSQDMARTLLPLLCQTRVFYRLPRNTAVCPLLRSLLHTGSPTGLSTDDRQLRRRHEDPIPFDLPPELKDDLEAESTPEPPRGTITRTERRAFQQLFEEVADHRATTGAKTGGDTVSEPSYFDAGVDHAQFPGYAPRLNFTAAGRDAINVIVGDAARLFLPGNMKILDTLPPLETASTSSDRQKALLRFPPSLRAAARIALGIFEPENNVVPRVAELPAQRDGARRDRDVLDDGGVALDPLAERVRFESMKREARVEMEKKMRDCKDDFALWDLMEKEIFSMVEKLGLAEGSKPKKAKMVARQAQNGKARSSAPEPGLRMDIYGGLYPSFLLYGLHLLDSHFAAPSALALAILPRVKELGLASYILGVSTSFYNSLMSVCWYRHGDIRAVLSLLEEMRQAGLYFDESTLGVIHNMRARLGQCMRGGPSFVVDVLAMPEFAGILDTRLVHWTKHVHRSLQERQGDLGTDV